MKSLLSFIFCGLFAIATHSQPQPDIIAGQVTRIIDGDTFELLQNSTKIRCRLAEIDAPEHDQPFGKQATDSLSKLLMNRQVLCLSLGKDLYTRRLVMVYQLDNQPINLDSILISKGLAWSMKGWHKGSYNLKADLNQVKAQAVGRGLWQCHLPILPHIWRNLNAKNKVKFNSCR